MIELLDQRSAVELAAALASHVAREAGIRLLVIKGFVLARQGLRADRMYSDVDVWVAADSVADFVTRLMERGWHVRGPNWYIDKVGAHSVTLIHDQWPCDIDVHVRFPGFMATDEEVFDELWARRSALEVASCEVFATSKAASALVLALHSERQPWDRSRQLETSEMVERLRSDPTVLDEMRRLSSVVGSNETLKSLFYVLGVEALPGYQATDAQLRHWRLRTTDPTRTGQWIAYLRSVPWRSRPRELVTVLWPPKSFFMQDHPETADSPVGLFAARATRLTKGVRAGVRLLFVRRRS